MKRVISMCASLAVVLAAAVSCCNKAPKVTALVAGPEAEPVARVVDYGAPVSAESVSPETFVVPGREIENVFVADCPEAASSVIILLKGNCPDKPCDKPAEEQCDKCKAGEPCEAKPCGKPAEEQCKKDGKCELPVPEIAVRQVAPVTGVDGKEIKPWKKDAKATAAAPAPRPHHHVKPCRK